MSNALDDLVDKVDGLVTEMRSNLPPDETSSSWYASISAQFLAFNRRLRDAIKEERTSRQNHGRFQTFDSARRAYMFETGNLVYDKETYEKFCKWLYDKKCDDDCPFYRIVEGEGECRPRCTNICGNCFYAREDAN